jgi:hypothetical protein
MCVLCSQLWVEDHWSDVASDVLDPGSTVVSLETHVARRGQRLRDRAERARLFNRVLQGIGLSLQDWEGSSYILRDAKGRAAVVSNLAQVWPEAESLVGRPLDPLDPVLLQNLRDRRHESR